MGREPSSQLRTQEQVDKRVPPEIWQRIFNRLYPSQLSRMSMVNKTFSKIVSSMAVWARIFSVTFGPKMRLRTLRNIPESKSYMLYIYASSLYICEECLALTNFEHLYVDRRRTQRAPAPMPTMTKGNIKYLGEEVDPHWTVRMCHACYTCRQKQISIIEVGDDTRTQARIRWYREQQ
ncbi:hypothetical protein BGX28_008043 [Mortierella sp. GBA30]|nr:hypothetical protein BGX28_008043 [Mortierella sp. GBA30]